MSGSDPPRDPPVADGAGAGSPPAPAAVNQPQGTPSDLTQAAAAVFAENQQASAGSSTGGALMADSSPVSTPRSPSSYTVSSPVHHALRRNSLAKIQAQQVAHGNQAEFQLAGHGAVSSGSGGPMDSPREIDLNESSSSEEDDTGALLRQSRARRESKNEIASRYVQSIPTTSSTRKREDCDFNTIFNTNDEDAEALRSEEPELGEWQLRAAAAVVRHRQSSTKVYASNGCDACSLSFRDPNAEQAFHYYFSSLNEHKLRRRLLLLNFLYMIYATIEWGTRTSKHYTRSQQNWITVLRVFYILVNAVIFTLSFIKRRWYRKNINRCSTVLAVLTSTLIIVEGHLLRNIYSPFVVLILIMYMVGSNIYVRTLFSVSVAVCWYNIILYNFMCLVFNPHGDLTTLHTTNDALLQLFYYDLILLFFLFTIIFQTRKVEKQNRYAFLQYYIEAEQEEREREQEEREREKRRAAGGAADGQGGSSKKKKRSAERQASNGSAAAGSDEYKSTSGGVGDGIHSVAAAPSSLPGGRPHLLPRTHSQELALLHHLNAAESAEDPFYLSRVAAMFLPQQQVTKSVRHEDGGEVGGVGSPVGGVSTTIPEEGSTPGGDKLGSVTHRLADGTFVTTSTTTETVYSNDPLYSTLSLMRAKGITSMPEFIRLLAHQNKVRLASNKISEMPCMCCASELPAWFTSYPYVETKYRVNYTARMCARSIFEWHNETINIWTEFIPCLVFLFGLIILESTNPVVFRATTPAWDRFFVMIGLLGGVVIRPLCSGLAHTFYPMSNRAFIIWWSIDYTSILISIMGYGLVMGRFTFYCMISQQIFFYISVIVLLLSTIAAVLFVASPGIRTSSFLLYVLFANGVPYIYQLVLTAADLEQHNVPKEYLVMWTLMWCLMLVGLLVKSAMIPERWFPGRFDVFFASHQWWHLLVNAGAAMAYFTWKSYLLWRPTVPCDPEAGLPD